MKILITDAEGAILYEGTPPLNGNGIRIGSDKQCDIQIRRLGISPEHLQLRTNAEGILTVQDLQSPFGTWVNGQKLAAGLVKAMPSGGVVKLSDEVTLHAEPIESEEKTQKQTLADLMNTTIFPFFMNQNDQFVQRSFEQLISKVPPAHHGAIRAAQGEIAHKVRELSAILEVTFGLNSILSFQRLLEFTLEMALAVTGAERGFISMFNEELDRLEIVATRGMPAREIEQDMLATAGPVLSAFRHSKTFAGAADLAEKATSGRHPTDQGIKALAVTPLKVQGSNLGVLYLDSKSHGNLFSDRTQNLLKVFATQAAVAIHRARLLHVATTDDLTGTSNQKHFHQRLLEEFSRAQRHKKPLSLILLDIDRFHEVNELFGEQAGDQILKQVGRIFRNSKRIHDMISRVGPDEFAMLLPETPRDGARIVAEKLRALIAETPFKIGRRSVSITGSFGLATTTAAMKKTMDLVTVTEKAVTRARKAGGNQIAAPRQAARSDP